MPPKPSASPTPNVAGLKEIMIQLDLLIHMVRRQQSTEVNANSDFRYHLGNEYGITAEWRGTPQSEFTVVYFDMLRPMKKMLFEGIFRAKDTGVMSKQDVDDLWRCMEGL